LQLSALTGPGHPSESSPSPLTPFPVVCLLMIFFFLGRLKCRLLTPALPSPVKGSFHEARYPDPPPDDSHREAQGRSRRLFGPFLSLVIDCAVEPLRTTFRWRTFFLFDTDLFFFLLRYAFLMGVRRCDFFPHHCLEDYFLSDPVFNQVFFLGFCPLFFVCPRCFLAIFLPPI